MTKEEGLAWWVARHVVKAMPDCQGDREWIMKHLAAGFLQTLRTVGAIEAIGFLCPDGIAVEYKCGDLK